MKTFRMFANKHYSQAMLAFQQAEKPQKAAICYAFLLREDARLVPNNQARERENAFIKAGEAFSSCAAESQPDEKAERLMYYANAADCFHQGHKFKEAGDCFVHAEQYTKAACAYREGGHFDEMVEVLEGYKDWIEAKVFVQLTRVAKMNYFKVGELSRMWS